MRSDGAPPSVWALGIHHAFNDSNCRRLIDPRKPPPQNPNFHPWNIALAKSGRLILGLIINSESQGSRPQASRLESSLNLTVMGVDRYAMESNSE